MTMAQPVGDLLGLRQGNPQLMKEPNRTSNGRDKQP
jgi:hypothetical protein